MPRSEKVEARELTAAEYKSAFFIGDAENVCKLKAALEVARDNRKFEIDLYWKRAAYFWTLITATFAGYFAIISAKIEPSERDFLAFVLSCIGLVFTFAWFQVDRGSKQWQGNWEAHVDMLEDAVTGPLYKTVLRRSPESMDWFDKLITGSARMSVSKINQIVNAFTMLVWAFLMAHAVWPAGWLAALPAWATFVVKFGSLFVVSMVFLRLIVKRGKTDNSNQTHEATQRTSGVSN